jgi:uncharacterized membrane protein
MAKRWGEKLREAIPILTMGAGLLALFLGVDNWWVIFVMGWVVLTPLANILTDHDEGDETPPTEVDDEREGDTQDALETLRDRYARGELTEEQFERKVERLLETETVEDARDRVAGERRRDIDAERRRDVDAERVTERER